MEICVEKKKKKKKVIVDSLDDVESREIESWKGWSISFTNKVEHQTNQKKKKKNFLNTPTLLTWISRLGVSLESRRRRR